MSILLAAGKRQKREGKKWHQIICLKPLIDTFRGMPLAVGILPFAFFAGCSVSHGIYHEVEKGETLWRIAKTYNVDVHDVAEANNMTDVRRIDIGQKIFIPGAKKVLKVRPYLSGEKRVSLRTYEKNIEGKEDNEIAESGRFIWPVKGKVISGFGMRDGKRHDGVDISSVEGTDVLAADDGEVIYSGNGLRGYGNLIIIQHRDNFVTIYAHNKENIAIVQQYVKRGEPIGKVGNSGNASSYHLHFEIRKDRRPINPVFFLP